MQAFTKGSGGTLSQYMNGAHKCMNLPPLRHSEKFSRGLTNQVSIFHSRKFDTKPLYWSFFLSIYRFPVTSLLLPRLTFQMNLLHSGHCARLCLWRNPLILYIQSITQPALNRFYLFLFQSKCFTCFWIFNNYCEPTMCSMLCSLVTKDTGKKGTWGLHSEDLVLVLALPYTI